MGLSVKLLECPHNMVAGFPPEIQECARQKLQCLMPWPGFLQYPIGYTGQRGRRHTQGHEFQAAWLMGRHLGGTYMFPKDLEWHAAQHEHSVHWRSCLAAHTLMAAPVIWNDGRDQKYPRGIRGILRHGQGMDPSPYFTSEKTELGE